ncbi:MAG TPA: GNAT family N-acetyltransferase, partial [Pyrinomonadaceae bacterium]|nr:GNAT family N-acetyltransferase [Pyrinomonadaceae bacterium]
MLKLKEAESPTEIDEARRLFEEYAAWLKIDLCFQNFEKELRELPGDYARPRGRLSLALYDEEVAGCIALRDLGEGVCEMKRLFVRPQFQGLGLGRVLTNHIIAEARALGYSRMRLDTLPSKMARAVAVYRSLGFEEIEPYYGSPMTETLYME